jgi:hypothetical protein
MAAQVVMATSNDTRFNPNNVFNEDIKQFWLTTGMFPQTLVVKLTTPQ